MWLRRRMRLGRQWQVVLDVLSDHGRLQLLRGGKQRSIAQPSKSAVFLNRNRITATSS